MATTFFVDGMDGMDGMGWDGMDGMGWGGAPTTLFDFAKNFFGTLLGSN